MGLVRSKRRWAVAAVALLPVLLVADAAVATLGARDDLMDAACDLRAASVHLTGLDLDAARRDVARATAQAEAARRSLDRATLSGASAVMGRSDDLDVARALGEVLSIAAGAANNGIDTLEEMGIGDGGAGGFLSGGRIDVARLEAAAGAAEDAAAAMKRAEDVLEGAPEPRSGTLRRAASAARRFLERGRGRLQDADALVDTLPGMLGQATPRRYFLALQTPTEARAGGGLVGVYGILSARAGRISLDEVEPIRSLVPLLRGEVGAPRWYEQLYGDLAGSRGWREANQSPSFPVSSEILLKMYERAVGERLDGVIAVDPIVLADALHATGPLEIAGYPDPVGPENAADILLRDIYVRFAHREDAQNRFLRDLVDTFWDAVGDGDADAAVLARSLRRSLETQHLKVYVREGDAQRALEAWRMTGDPAAYAPSAQMVFHNNLVATKVDLFLRRSQQTRIELDPNGDARVTTSILLANDAPRGPQGVLTNTPINDLPRGLNQMTLHFLLPRDARLGDVYVGGRSHRPFRGKEAGIFPTYWLPVQIEPGDALQVTATYTLRRAAVIDGERGKLRRMTFLPQALVRPDDFRLEVVPPDGYAFSGRGADGDGALRVEGTLGAPRTLQRTFTRGAPRPEERADLDALCGP